MPLSTLFRYDDNDGVYDKIKREYNKNKGKNIYEENKLIYKFLFYGYKSNYTIMFIIPVVFLFV